MLSIALILALKLICGEKIRRTPRTGQPVGSEVPRNPTQELQEIIGLSALGNYYVTIHVPRS